MLSDLPIHVEDTTSQVFRTWDGSKMKFALITLLASASFYTTTAIPTSNSHVLHEKRIVHGEIWTKRWRTPAEHILPMRIGLKQRNLDHADRFLMDIADPTSPNYGKHWSAEKVAKTFAPSKEASDKTLDWLVSSGVSIERLKYSVGKCLYRDPYRLWKAKKHDRPKLGGIQCYYQGD